MEYYRLFAAPKISPATQYVGLEKINNGIWDVYFGQVKLGRLTEEQMRIEDEPGRLWRHKKKCNPGAQTFCYPCPRLLTGGVF
jgi:hypothetical protein